MQKDNEEFARAGTTMAAAIIRGNKLFVSSVGDSSIIIAEVDENNELIPKQVHQVHRPDNPKERKRIEKLGGQIKIVNNSERVLINKYNDHPKLNLTRSLGDTWSLLSAGDFLISPVPDISIFSLYPSVHKFILLVTDGITDVLSPKNCIKITNKLKKDNLELKPGVVAVELINTALQTCEHGGVMADNMSAVIVFIK